jgi:hypothetical protein
MNWNVENTDEFGIWFVDLSEADQDAILMEWEKRRRSI